MLDSGNFIIFNRTHVLWESFNYPTDTILAGQNLVSDHSLVSATSASDHSTGRFHLAMQSDGNLVAYPLNSLNRAEDAYWDSKTFISNFLDTSIQLTLNLSGQLFVNISFSSSSFRVHSISTVKTSEPSGNITTVFRATLDPDGIFRLYSHSFQIMDKYNSTFLVEWSSLQDQCAVTGFCGLNSYCSSNSSTGKGDCSCFPGFLHIDPSTSRLGCYRESIEEDLCALTVPGFSYNLTTLEKIELGGYPYSSISIIEGECGKSCLNDCYCWVAVYASATCSKYKLPLVYSVLNRNISGKAFIKQISNDTEIPGNAKRINGLNRSKRKIILILLVVFGSLAVSFCLVAVSSFLFYRKSVVQYQKLSQHQNVSINEDLILRSFSLNELQSITHGFREVVGHTSLGKVYKGTTSNDKFLSVKRLENFEEGEEKQFRAEITSIGRTHHRNLVQLIGFCLEGSNKLLVYEFMSKGSLANVLFDEGKLHWKQRISLAMDIARGILYLHEECETPMIHCNISTKNVLVDESDGKWTAKLSNFESAKLIGRNGTASVEEEARECIAPELHTRVLLSEKVDVYSYGVVLLEILCWRSNMDIRCENEDEILLSSWVHKCLMQKELRKLIGDEEIDMKLVERMVKVALLCIQENPDLRPDMKTVILMLEDTLHVKDPCSTFP